jgi:hypothetical protein
MNDLATRLRREASDRIPDSYAGTLMRDAANEIDSLREQVRALQDKVVEQEVSLELAERSGGYGI